MKNLLFLLIIAIAGFAIYGSFGLVVDEWAAGNICPKILGIPACYIVIACFIVALIAHLLPFNNNQWVFFLFVGMVTLIASTGTFGELTETAKCPRTTGGTPMCFISLAICLSLLTLKVVSLRFSKHW